MTLKLFVADDSVTIQKVIGLAFSDTDTAIESVTRGEEALDAVRTFRPDIVLADVCMPGINGYEICSLVKKSPDLSRIPVVLLVGTFEKFDEAAADRVQYDARLTKPFDTAELVNVVHRLVGRNAVAPETDSAVGSANEAYSRTEAFPEDHAGFFRKISLSRKALDSFLSECRVLDVFDAEFRTPGAISGKAGSSASIVVEAEKPIPAATAPITAENLPEEVLDAIVERVVKRMSEDVVSEIAWEVVPELSEILIRRSIEENRKV
jgi:CheY-like chemotaxis protein